MRGKEDIKEPSPLKTRRQRKKEKEVVENTTKDSKDSVIVVLFCSIHRYGLALQTVFVQFFGMPYLKEFLLSFQNEIVILKIGS